MLLTKSDSAGDDEVLRPPHHDKGNKKRTKTEEQIDSLMKEHEPDRQLYRTGKRLDQLD